MLIEFLADTIGNMVDGFRDDILTVYVFEESPGKFIATGNHPKKLLFYRVEPHKPIAEEIEAPAYLGALQYLRGILSSSLMEDATVHLTYQEGKRQSITAMKFVASSFESQFQCTNPNVLNDKERVRQFPRPDDAIFFPINKDLRKKFDEVARFGTPKADVRLFTLAYEKGRLKAIFGSGTHTSTLTMTDEITGKTDQDFQKQVSLDRFRQMLKLASDHTDGKGGFHPNAVWVDFNTLVSAHTIAAPTIREQAR
jgi:hypothetical protein